MSGGKRRYIKTHTYDVTIGERTKAFIGLKSKETEVRQKNIETIAMTLRDTVGNDDYDYGLQRPFYRLIDWGDIHSRRRDTKLIHCADVRALTNGRLLFYSIELYWETLTNHIIIGLAVLCVK